MTQPTPTTKLPIARHPHPRCAPFLVWPVARREFYAAISAALALPLLWGILIFGWRALAVLIATLAGALLTHLLLKKITRRAREMVLAHTILSALMLVTLSQALWPPLLMFSLGILLVILIWTLGKAGHTRLHASLLVALAATLLLAPPRHERQFGPILARDRLLMGDLAQSSLAVAQRWPHSYEINGQDAVLLSRPNAVVNNLLSHIAHLQAQSQSHLPSAPNDLPTTIQSLLNDTLVTRLPPLEYLLLGLTPGPIGAVSALGITLGGLYLAYRNILRPRSTLLFLLSAILGLTLSTLLPFAHPRSFPNTLGGPWQLIPVETMATLLFYILFSSDILFAAVFLLALPGSEPITRRGRWWFILLAGLLAGFLQRLNLPLPAATLTLFLLAPLSPLFDKTLGKRSWLAHK